MLCLSAVATGCGGDGEERGKVAGGAERLKACLRDSGATIHRLPPLRVSHAPYERERFGVELKTGDSAVVRVLTSRAVAEREARQRSKRRSAVTLQKGVVLLAYSGSPAGTTILEDCLRASDTGSDPERGEIARQLRRIEARREAFRAQYRNRQYNTPHEIRSALSRLRSYHRYRLYYLGQRYRDLPLTAVVTKLQPPAYEPAIYPPDRPPRPSSPTFTFIYGTCKPPPDEGGCPPPLSIQNFEVCAVSPHSHGVPPSALTERIRGVPYLINAGAGSLNLFTGATTITIFSTHRLAMRAAEDLRSLDGRIGPRSELSPPVPGALEGRLRCRPPDED